jgi:hypothetical protein
MINHPKEFVERMINRINSASKRQQKKGKKVFFRWHDSGDFFSPTYARMALYIASKTPDVLHYAYTKQVKMIKDMVSSGEVPSNFIFNYSFAGQQDNLIDRATDKFSFVIKPEEDLVFNLGSFKKTWKQLMVAQGSEKKAKGELKKAKDNGDQTAISTAQQNLTFASQVVDEALQKVDRDCMNETLKSGIEKKLGLPSGSVITYFEMVDKPENPEQNPKWSVLVYPGCGDGSAARKDVSGTLLLIH